MARSPSLPARIYFKPEYREPVSRFECPICHEVGIESYPDASDWTDDRGNRLRDAGMTPSSDWVCSQPCRSQLMFQKASDRDRAALQRYELALRELLSESSDDVEALLKIWGCHVDIKPGSLGLARYALGAMNRRAPRNNAAWVENNESPEDRMREAIGEALHILDCRATVAISGIVQFLRSLAAVMPGQVCGADIISRDAARALGTLYTVISELKDAVAGEVR